MTVLKRAAGALKTKESFNLEDYPSRERTFLEANDKGQDHAPYFNVRPNDGFVPLQIN